MEQFRCEVCSNVVTPSSDTATCLHCGTDYRREGKPQVPPAAALAAVGGLSPIIGSYLTGIKVERGQIAALGLMGVGIGFIAHLLVG